MSDRTLARAGEGEAARAALLARCGVEVRAGALSGLPERLPPAPARLLLTDRNVLPLVPPAWRALPRHVLEPGEASKNWHELGRLLEALDATGLDRDGELLALGGGVVTDLGGLAASLHRRGLSWIALPTSLVGQVDAAVGGKTAVNLGGGKNTVGTFHPPSRVVVDPRALATLPLAHLRAGLAEVLKTALIAGEPLFSQACALEPEDVAAGSARAVEVLRGCLATKLALVEQDLRDHGPRRLLNLGHTFGHAFESLALGERLHGEAVGLGLLCAARAARRLLPDAEADLGARLRARLAAWGLPVEAAEEPAAVLAQLGRDKKRKGGRPTLVLPAAPGRVVLLEGVDPASLEDALAAVTPRGAP